MKRMSEVFELPLSQLPESDDQIQDSNEDWALIVRFPWRADYVINAINHVDALADALENIIGATDEYDECSAIVAAKSALKSYRG